jgi:hypothetical protein
VKAMAPLAGILLLLVSAARLPAQYPQPCPPVVPQAPDARWPGYYCINPCGQWYGPNHCVYPPYLPFQGMVLPPRNCGNGGMMGGGSPSFPTHPFARSPRDFFMVD